MNINPHLDYNNYVRLQNRKSKIKLVGELKKQVEGTNNKEEAKELIEDAGMLLTDDELDWVTGGGKSGKVSKKVIK